MKVTVKRISRKRGEGLIVRCHDPVALPGLPARRPDILICAGFILLAGVLRHLVNYSLNAKTAAQISEKIRMNRMNAGSMDDRRKMK